jgi:hypothetical protein
MKLSNMAAPAAIALGLCGVAHAQVSKTDTELKVKDGKDVTVVGCIERNEDGKFLLTHAADRKRPLQDYVLATDDDLSKHIGHRVQISGIAADRGDGKVEIKTKTKAPDDHGDDRKIESKSEIKGNLGRLPYLSVKSVKMLAAVCD